MNYLTRAIARVPETFIGNDKKAKRRKSKKTKEITAQLGRGKSAILEAKSIPRKSIIKGKTRKATLSQKQCVWAITKKLYNNSDLANEVSKRIAKSFDLANKKIQELNQIQESRKIAGRVANW